jgi:hypothetical protein
MSNVHVKTQTKPKYLRWGEGKELWKLRATWDKKKKNGE